MLCHSVCRLSTIAVGYSPLAERARECLRTFWTPSGPTEGACPPSQSDDEAHTSVESESLDGTDPLGTSPAADVCVVPDQSDMGSALPPSSG